MQMVPEEEVETVKQHVLTCQECLQWLQAEIDFVTAMRGAATKIREKEQK
jgi:hypothetical protein